MRNTIVVFGSGATGRAHIGLLAWQAGFEIVFVDKKKDLVDRLRKEGSYRVDVHGKDVQEVRVTGFQVYSSEERDRIADVIVNSCLVLTSVFDQNLPDVAKTIALAGSKCRLSRREDPLNFIACENMANSSSSLKKSVLERIKAEEDLDYVKRTFGFPDCMISRVVPQPEDDPLRLVTEDYNEWTVDEFAFLGEKPARLRPLTLVKNQAARLERKLYVHNGGHATAGYFAYHRGWEYIHEALTDPLVVKQTVGALDELGEVVIHKHNFDPVEINEYKDDLKRRGALAALKDRVDRVIRDPLRKLSPSERLVAPALYAEEHGLDNHYLARSIAAAARYNEAHDLQSMKLKEMIAADGLPAALHEIGGIPVDSSLMGKIVDAWQQWDQLLLTPKR